MEPIETPPRHVVVTHINFLGKFLCVDKPMDDPEVKGWKHEHASEANPDDPGGTTYCRECVAAMERPDWPRA